MQLEPVKARGNVVALRGGALARLRPMVAEDCQPLTDLFASASDEDMRYLRDDIRDPAVVQAWCRKVRLFGHEWRDEA